MQKSLSQRPYQIHPIHSFINIIHEPMRMASFVLGNKREWQWLLIFRGFKAPHFLRGYLRAADFRYIFADAIMIGKIFLQILHSISFVKSKYPFSDKKMRGPGLSDAFWFRILRTRVPSLGSSYTSHCTTRARGLVEHKVDLKVSAIMHKMYNKP